MLTNSTPTVTYMKLLGALRLKKRWRRSRAASVMAAGSVMNDPRSGPMDSSTK
jgi:hypothetical protein